MGSRWTWYEEEEGVFFEDHSSHILMDDTLARLLTFPNVVITSHQAFLTEEALAEIARVTVNKHAPVPGWGTTPWSTPPQWLRSSSPSVTTPKAVIPPTRHQAARARQRCCSGELGGGWPSSCSDWVSRWSLVTVMNGPRRCRWHIAVSCWT